MAFILAMSLLTGLLDQLSSAQIGQLEMCALIALIGQLEKWCAVIG